MLGDVLYWRAEREAYRLCNAGRFWIVVDPINKL